MKTSFAAKTTFAGKRWDVECPAGASVGPLACDYDASLVGATVTCSVLTQTGVRHNATVTITDASAGLFAVHFAGSLTRTIGIGEHTWACEITAAGITRQAWQGRFVVTKETAA